MAYVNVLRDPLKIAYCLSGQARNMTDAAPTYAVAGDWFVSTWRKRGRKLDGALDEKSFRRMFPSNVVASFIYDYQGALVYRTLPFLREALVSDIVSMDDVSIEDIKRIIPEAVINIDEEDAIERVLSATDGSVVRNSLKMLNRIYDANNLVKDNELRLRRRYDIVVRVRPDLIVTGLPDITTFHLDDNRLYLDWVDHVGRGCGDKLAIGSSIALDKFATLYEHYLKAIETRSTPQMLERSIHEVVYDHLASIGVDMRDIRELGVTTELSEDKTSLASVLQAADRALESSSPILRRRAEAFSLQVSSYAALDEGEYARALTLAEDANALDPNALGPLRIFLLHALATNNEEQALRFALNLMEKFGPIGLDSAGGTAKRALLAQVEDILVAHYKSHGDYLTHCLERRAATLAAEASDFALSMFTVLIKSGQKTKAMSVAVEAIRQNPHDESFLLRIASVLEASNAHEDAVLLLKTSGSRVAYPEMILQAIVRLCRSGSLEAERISALKEVINIAANPLHYLGELAGCYVAAGDAVEAQKLLDRAMTLDATSPWLHRIQSRTHDISGCLNEAIASLVRSEELGGTDGHGLAQLGALYVRAADLSAAMSAFEACIKKSPSNVWAWKQIIEILERQGLAIEACNKSAEAVDANPDDESLISVRTRLLQRYLHVSAVELK